MTPERWQAVERVCQAALDQPPEERATFLDRECRGDPDLRREVESLLGQQADAEAVLRTPPWEAVAGAFAEAPAARPRLERGRRLGPFEVQALVGAGGMGEVYRARDTRLGRTVALKVLPPAAAADPDRRARLEAEARAASALAHPHICALFDIRSDDGVDYLVMEYLEGETLAERMARPRFDSESAPSPGLGFEEALEYGAQIANALAAAHRRGIVHRDLKPGNVMITRAGVKLLDFGLAKVRPSLDAVIGSGSSAGRRGPQTAAGVVLGTVNYMAPEQLQGKEAEPRSDLFAFGALLCEMLTGSRAFEGSTPASVSAAILEREPAVPPEWQTSIPSLDRLVRGCLMKDPDERWDSARLAEQELRQIAAGADAERRDVRALSAGEPGRTHRPRPAVPRWLSMAATAGVVAAALAFAVLVWPGTSRAPASNPLQRLDLDLGMGFTAHPWMAKAVLSPDGTRVAFAGFGPGRQAGLFIRRFDQAEVTTLVNGDVTDVFFSPDGLWIGFVGAGKLRRVSVAGGPVMDLCDAPGDTRGASWGDAGFIVCSFGPSFGLSRLPAAGGQPVPLTTLDASRGEVTHRWPQVMPGSDVVIFTAHTFAGRYDDATLEAVSVRSGQRKTLHRGGYFGRYLPSGHLVFVRHNALFAVPVDLSRLQVTGRAVPVLDAVVSDQDLGNLEFSSSVTGDALTFTGEWQAPANVPSWRDRAGAMTPLSVPAARYTDPRVSPDGRRVVLTVAQGGIRQLLVYDQDRREPFRLVSSAIDVSPVWAPDGEHLVFGSDEDQGICNLYWRRADGAGNVCRLTRHSDFQIAGSFTSDGRRLAYAQMSAATGMDILTIPLGLGDRDRPTPGTPVPLVQTPASEEAPAFSPDGRWLAYASDESGLMEVYIRAAGAGGAGGATGDKWQVSQAGGSKPVWSRDGRQLFFEAPSRHLMVTDISAQGHALVARAPRRWAEWTLPVQDPRYASRNFDLSPDGKRVLVLEPAASDARPGPRAAVTLLVHFFDELRRRAPVGRGTER